MSNVLIMGCGWVGFPLAIELTHQGYTVYGTTRSVESESAFQKEGITHIQCEVGQENHLPFELLEQLEVLIIAYPLGSRRMTHTEEYLVHTNWLRSHLFDKITKETQVILLSSTSVYPDHVGEVDEDCSEPPDGAGLIQLNFEKSVRQIWPGNLAILRLAGLIGEGRHPGTFFRNKTVVEDGDSPVNLVHRDDVIRFVCALLKSEDFNGVFNVCANEHPSRKEFYTKQISALGLPVPAFLSSSSSKRNGKLVSNRKGRQMLKFRYFFPLLQ